MKTNDVVAIFNSFIIEKHIRTHTHTYAVDWVKRNVTYSCKKCVLYTIKYRYCLKMPRRMINFI